MNLSENREIAQTKLETAEDLNKFFLQHYQNLEISKFYYYEYFIENMEDKILRALFKFKNHSIITAIQNAFCFTGPEVKEIEKEIQNLVIKKLANNLIFPNFIKENTDIYDDFLCKSIND